jgi:hypothetical protein
MNAFTLITTNYTRNPSVIHVADRFVDFLKERKGDEEYEEVYEKERYDIEFDDLQR